MTFALFISLFLALFVAVLNFLPLAGPLNPAIVSSIYFVIGTMKAWNFMFPITELFICVGIVMSYELLYWSWKVVIGVVHLIRGTNQGN